MKKILFLILCPFLLNAQPKNRYVHDDSTLLSVELKLHLKDGRTITLPGIQRAFFFNDTTFIARYPDTNRLWFPIDIALVVMKTTFGLMSAGTTWQQTEQILTLSGIPIVRVPIFFSQQTSNNIIDTYLDDGYDVQINFNYMATSSTVPFPTDTNFIRKQAHAFFEHYKDWVTHIPFVAVENEWDNTDYHSGTVQDYLTELRIVTDEGHKYGFKIADAGITDGGIKKWSIGNFDASEYIAGIQTININYLNFHWYVSANAIKDFDLRQSVTAYKAACNKDEVVTNEFGIRSITPDLWLSLINTLKSYVQYAIGYSGISKGDDNKAIQLTTDMLKEMQ